MEAIFVGVDYGNGNTKGDTGFVMQSGIKRFSDINIYDIDGSYLLCFGRDEYLYGDFFVRRDFYRCR